MGSRQGLTLIEVALFLCLLGVVSAVSVPTFLRALRTSKMAEAPLELSRIYAAVAAYYATPQPASSASAPRADADTSGGRLRCLPEAAGPTPSQPSKDPTQIAFAADDTPGAPTWRAIAYQPSAPIRYRYSLLPGDAGCGNLAEDSHGQAVLSLRAEGDLDGDGVLSQFERSATIRQGELALDPLLTVRDRVE